MKTIDYLDILMRTLSYLTCQCPLRIYFFILLFVSFIFAIDMSNGDVINTVKEVIWISFTYKCFCDRISPVGENWKQ